jgi:hypothetical protein
MEREREREREKVPTRLRFKRRKTKLKCHLGPGGMVVYKVAFLNEKFSLPRGLGFNRKKN